MAEETAIDHFYAEVGRRVRLARGKRTQAQIAAALGMTRSSIANLEAGRQRIPLHLLVLIAEITNTPVSEFLPRRSLLDGTELFGLIDWEDVPASNRDFIQGAIAQLKMQREEDG